MEIIVNSFLFVAQANQCLDDNTPGTLSSKIMDKIDLARDGSCVLLVVRCVPPRNELLSFTLAPQTNCFECTLTSKKHRQLSGCSAKRARWWCPTGGSDIVAAEFARVSLITPDFTCASPVLACLSWGYWRCCCCCFSQAAMFVLGGIEYPRCPTTLPSVVE